MVQRVRRLSPGSDRTHLSGHAEGSGVRVPHRQAPKSGALTSLIYVLSIGTDHSSIPRAGDAVALMVAHAQETWRAASKASAQRASSGQHAT